MSIFSKAHMNKVAQLPCGLCGSMPVELHHILEGRTPGRRWFRDRFIYADGLVEVRCSECNKPYWLPPSKASKYITCCGDCSKIRRAKLRELRRRICEVCDKEFYPRWLQIDSGQGRFCSRKCHGIANTGLSNPMYGKSITKEQKEKWRNTRDNNESWITGEKHPNWNGGKEARKIRQRESGERRIRCHNRRAKIRENGGKLSKGLQKKLYELQKGKCACCKRPLGKDFHLDHIIPIALGGKNEDSNIQLLRAKCNLQKQSLHPVDFMQKRGYLL